MNASSGAIVSPTRTRVLFSVAMAALLVLSMFSAVVGIQQVSAQDTTRDLASAAPADTVLFMSVNLDQESDQFTQTFSLLERAGFNQLLEEEVGASSEELGDVAEDANVTGSGAIVFTDADSLVSYSSADFSSAMDTASVLDTTGELDAEQLSDEIPEGFAFIIQPNDPDALGAQFITMAEDEAAANNVTLQTVEYSGVTITYWESDEPAVNGTATAVVDGTVVLATRASDIEPIIDAAQGNTDNLADSDGFQDVSGRLAADTLVFGYMNLDVLFTAYQTDGAFIESLGEIMDPEELDAAKGHVGFALYASEAGFHADSVYVPNDASQLDGTSTYQATLPGKLPADVLLFSGANNLYGTGISDYMGEFFQTVLSESDNGTGSPTAVATPTVEETWAMFEQQLGFNPDTDLLALLDGEFSVTAGVYNLESGFPSPEFLFVSETSDAETLAQTTQTISQLAEMMNEGEYTLSTRTVEGGELTVVELDSESTGGIPVVIEFGVVNDELLIGVNGAIERYLDPATNKLADDANYQMVMDALPADKTVSSVSYLNIEGQLMPLLDWFATMLMSSTATLDNNEECGIYATQIEAQTAFDADPGALWLLDMDFDGEACEDFFGAPTASASPESFTSMINVPAAGGISFVEDGAMYQSSVLIIGD